MTNASSSENLGLRYGRVYYGKGSSSGAYIVVADGMPCRKILWYHGIHGI